MYFDIDPKDLAFIYESCSPVFEEMRGKRLFMTGGTGFFGKWLTASIIWANDHHKMDINLTLMTRSPEGFLKQYPDGTHESIRLFKGDIRFSIFPNEEFDYLIHMATDPGYMEPEKHLEIVEGMLSGTRRVMQFAHAAKVKSVVFSSSGAVYGPVKSAEQKLSEDYDVGPDQLKERSIFGTAKRMCEQWGAHFHHQHGLNIKFARCFAFYGPHMPYDHYAIGNFIRDAIANKDIVLKGDGKALRSYMYGADLAVWMWHILINGKSNRAYNVGSDEAISMINLVSKIKQETNSKSKVSVLGQAEKYPDRTFYVPSLERAKDELGLENRTLLSEGINKTAAWLALPQNGIPSEHGLIKSDHKKKIVVDIDGVIASITPDNDYNLAKPLLNNIEQINRLHGLGYEVVLFTARGYESGIDWREVTEAHLKSWGVQYDALFFGKPSATYYVDDKMIPLDMLAVLT